MKKRLIFFIKEVLKISLTDLAGKIETNRSYLSQILSENSNREVGIELLVRIKNVYPSMNLNFIISGQGNVWLDSNAIDYQYTPDNCAECKRKDSLIVTLQRSLSQALDTNEMLRTQLNKALESQKKTKKQGGS